MSIDDNVSKEIMLDPVDFKLVLAKHYLDQILDNVPLDACWDHFLLESATESFLFYANLAIEILTKEINDEFQLTPEKKFNIYRIQRLLDPTIPRQNHILQIINSHFQKPSKEFPAAPYDYSRSSLWQLREIRNHVTHERIINRIAFRGTVMPENAFLLRFTIQRENSENGSTEITEQILLKNPKDYFSQLFSSLKVFRKQIRSNIAYKYESLQHENDLSFKLG